MSVHDAVSVYRRRIVGLVENSVNKRLACRQLGIHHSTYYRWRDKVEQPAPGPLRGSSFTDQRLERQVVGFSLANPALGSQRVADELSRQGTPVGPSKVWRIMVKHRINTRQLRYSLLAGHRQPHNPQIVVAHRPHPRGA